MKNIIKLATKGYLITFVLLIILYILTFLDSFFFALGGDDWLALYRYITVYPTLISHFDLKNFSTNYDIANIMMGIIYRFFEFNPFPYFLTSHFLRIMAGISLYLPTYLITKNKLAASLSSVFFMFAFAGIETTNWVFNMNSYFSVAFLNLFLYFFLKKKLLDFRWTHLFLISMLLFATFIITPTRMHGLLFFVPFMVIFNLEKFNLNSFLRFLKITFILLLPSILFRLFVLGGSESGYFTFSSVQPLSELIHIFNFIASLGAGILPDEFIKITSSSSSLSIPTVASLKTFFPYFLLFELVSIVMVFGLSFTLNKSKPFIITTLVAVNISYLIFLIALNTDTVSNFSNKSFFLQAMTGIAFFITITSYFLFLKKDDRDFSKLGLISLAGSFLFYVMPWIISPVTTLASDHRYLIVPVSFLSIVFSLIITRLTQQEKFYGKQTAIGLVILILMINIFSLQHHLHTLRQNGRDQAMVSYYFSEIEKNIGEYNPNAPLIYLFESENPNLVYHAIGFGFTPHVILTFENINKDLSTAPFGVDSRKSLKEVLTDPEGKELLRYGYKPMKIPYENIYAFYVTPKKILNTSDEVRTYLKTN